jgi:hypothetical protein
MDPTPGQHRAALLQKETTVKKPVNLPNLKQTARGIPPLAMTILPPLVSVPFTAGNAPVRSVPNLQPSAPAPAMNTAKVQPPLGGKLPPALPAK